MKRKSIISGTLNLAGLREDKDARTVVKKPAGEASRLGGIHSENSG